MGHLMSDRHSAGCRERGARCHRYLSGAAPRGELIVRLIVIASNRHRTRADHRGRWTYPSQGDLTLRPSWLMRRGVKGSQGQILSAHHFQRITFSGNQSFPASHCQPDCHLTHQTAAGARVLRVDTVRAVRLYQSGLTVRQVAAELGAIYPDVRDELLAAGVTLRGPRGQGTEGEVPVFHRDYAREAVRRRAHAAMPAEVRQQILEGLAAGEPFRDVIKRLGVTSNRVWGLTLHDETWASELDEILLVMRRRDLRHGASTGYQAGCVCPDCRAYNRGRRSLRK
jgi:hypothetical protein